MSKATGPTDVHILQNKVAPGGTFRWHSHPGPSIVIVHSSGLTVYRADDRGF
jgi:quercetin dioxygenase-like cupin family protein